MRILSYTDAIAIVNDAFARGALSACLASPRDALELFASDGMDADDLRHILRAVEAGSYEEFPVADRFGSSASIEGVRVVDDKFLRFLLDLWMTAPVFRCFSEVSMLEINGRLEPAESHEFFCENPCDFERVGQKLEIDKSSGWIMAFDQYCEKSGRFVMFDQSIVSNQDTLNPAHFLE